MADCLSAPRRWCSIQTPPVGCCPFSVHLRALYTLSLFIKDCNFSTCRSLVVTRNLSNGHPLLGVLSFFNTHQRRASTHAFRKTLSLFSPFNRRHRINHALRRASLQQTVSCHRNTRFQLQPLPGLLPPPTRTRRIRDGILAAPTISPC